MYNKYKYYVQGTAHIWQCAVNMYNESSSGRVASSEEEIDNPDGKDVFEEPFQKLIRTKTDYIFVYFQHTFSFLNLLLF